MLHRLAMTLTLIFALSSCSPTMTLTDAQLRRAESLSPSDAKLAVAKYFGTEWVENPVVLPVGIACTKTRQLSPDQPIEIKFGQLVVDGEYNVVLAQIDEAAPCKTATQYFAMGETELSQAEKEELYVALRAWGLKNFTVVQP